MGQRKAPGRSTTGRLHMQGHFFLLGSETLKPGSFRRFFFGGPHFLTHSTAGSPSICFLAGRVAHAGFARWEAQNGLEVRWTLSILSFEEINPTRPLARHSKESY